MLHLTSLQPDETRLLRIRPSRYFSTNFPSVLRRAFFPILDKFKLDCQPDVLALAEKWEGEKSCLPKQTLPLSDEEARLSYPANSLQYLSNMAQITIPEMYGSVLPLHFCIHPDGHHRTGLPRTQRKCFHGEGRRCLLIATDSSQFVTASSRLHSFCNKAGPSVLPRLLVT